jgi:hypothetical protein
VEDISTVSIATGIFGSVTIGTFVFLMMQIIKGFAGEVCSGARAEAIVLGVSCAAVVVALVSVHSDWETTDTWVALITGTLGTTIIARGLYSQLFKVSVAGMPPSSDAEATTVTDTGTGETTTTDTQIDY